MIQYAIDTEIPVGSLVFYTYTSGAYSTSYKARITAARVVSRTNLGYRLRDLDQHPGSNASVYLDRDYLISRHRSQVAAYCMQRLNKLHDTLDRLRQECREQIEAMEGML